MHPYHRRFIYAQLVVLLWAIFVLLVFPQWKYVVFPSLSAFFLFEIGVLETQRKELPEAMRYRKSGIFALIDVLSVILFLIIFVLYGTAFFSEKSIFHSTFTSILLTYTTVRKFYILKNYSYEI
ncbi:hypothetical protein [Chryseobacterium sp.]|uniref:hypothetical protein n=1 Tax=Chryseobacterium sp. TaxID=1871047 RepID=UPI00389084A5